MCMCMRVDGVVQGYRVVPAEQLPSGGGLGEGFSPAAVSECAVSVLRFLRSHCTREAGAPRGCHKVGPVSLAPPRRQ